MIIDLPIRVMSAHGTPLVQAGLEAALRNLLDFEIVPAPCGIPQPQDLASVAVVVTECELGVRLARSVAPSGCHVLIISHDHTEANIRRAIEAGVRGYLLVTSGVDALVRAVRCIYNGGTALDPLVATKMVDSLTCDRLTPRETDVLRLLMLGMSNKSIANTLATRVGTVKHHVKSVLAKLKARGRTEAVAIARRRGLFSEVELGTPQGHRPDGWTLSA
jgi:DNA-binding NarL/FixJ family response regulator